MQYKTVAATVLALSANAITPPKYTYDLEKPGILGGSWTTQSSVLVWQGKWGNWDNLKSCPQNYYVCGLQTRMESDQGFYSDDTALNGMKMQCCQKSSTTSKTNVTISDGYYGDWGNMTFCTDGSYVCGMGARYEAPGNADETALNGVAATCCSTSNWDVKNNHVVEQGIWGIWEQPAYLCPKSSYVCGYEWQIQAPQGTFGDDTAANGFRMQCCGY